MHVDLNVMEYSLSKECWDQIHKQSEYVHYEFGKECSYYIIHLSFISCEDQMTNMFPGINHLWRSTQRLNQSQSFINMTQRQELSELNVIIFNDVQSVLIGLFTGDILPFQYKLSPLWLWFVEYAEKDR